MVKRLEIISSADGRPFRIMKRSGTLHMDRDSQTSEYLKTKSEE